MLQLTSISNIQLVIINHHNPNRHGSNTDIRTPRSGFHFIAIMMRIHHQSRLGRKVK